MSIPTSIKIVEVGPRDGLQNESGIVLSATKIELIDRLSETGLQAIEAGSFVSPKWVPQMADTDKVFAGIKKKPGVSYPVLVPNDKGLESAIAAGVSEIAVFLSASETFSQKNINATIAESFERIQPVIEKALANNIKVRGYVSCVMGCPYEGDVRVESVVNVAKKLYDMGCYEISLGDTIGVGYPLDTRMMVRAVKEVIPVSALAIHCHDTYNRALLNIAAVIEEGVAVVDSSVGGLGGCPYAKGATGNVATGEVLEMLETMGIKTGVDRAEIQKTAQWIRAALGKK